MRNLLILGSAVLTLTVFGCGSNPAGSITGPAADKIGGSSTGSGVDENFIGPPVKTDLTARKPLRFYLDDPKDENIIGPPMYTDLD
jgi:hypothetical protein